MIGPRSSFCCTSLGTPSSTRRDTVKNQRKVHKKSPIKTYKNMYGVFFGSSAPCFNGTRLNQTWRNLKNEKGQLVEFGYKVRLIVKLSIYALDQ